MSIKVAMEEKLSKDARKYHDEVTLDPHVARDPEEVRLALEGVVQARDELDRGQATADGDEADSYVGDAAGRTLFRGLDPELRKILFDGLRHLDDMDAIYEQGDDAQ